MCEDDTFSKSDVINHRCVHQDTVVRSDRTGVKKKTVWYGGLCDLLKKGPVDTPVYYPQVCPPVKNYPQVRPPAPVPVPVPVYRVGTIETGPDRGVLGGATISV